MKSMQLTEYGLGRDLGEVAERVGSTRSTAVPASPTTEPVLDMRLAKSLVPLKSMTDAHLAELLDNSRIETVFRDQVLFQEGSYDSQVIYLLHGELELTYDAQSGRTEHVSADVLTPVAPQQPRPCRATAMTDCSVLRVDAEYLDKMLCWSQAAEYLLLDISYQRDLDEDVEWMMTILKSNLFFKVPPINMPMIFDRLETRVVEAGEAILRQGEIGDNCYFIKEGRAEVRRSPDGSRPPERIAEIGPGRCFGEDALVYETVRNASVIMQTDGVLMYLSKRNFLKLLKEPKVATVDGRDMQQCIADGAICIDVRTEEEYAAGHLDRAINIPLNLLRIKTRLLDPNARYVIVCDSGRRGRAGAHLLAHRSFDAVALGGGMRGLRGDFGQLVTTSYLLKDGQILPDL